MWIRSQEKDKLIRVSYVKVINSYGFEIIANNDIFIGSYKTKERAKQVLDEIGYAISDGIDVYEMPEE